MRILLVLVSLLLLPEMIAAQAFSRASALGLDVHPDVFASPSAMLRASSGAQARITMLRPPPLQPI